jgi:hypothetical protein
LQSDPTGVHFEQMCVLTAGLGGAATDLRTLGEPAVAPTVQTPTKDPVGDVVE